MGNDVRIASLAILFLICLALVGMGNFKPGHDTDGDGIKNKDDSCIEHPNAGALGCDTDGDGFGNVCDCDFDQNGQCWASDVTIFTNNFGKRADLPTDMNYDGVTGGPDYALFLGMFGGRITGPAEPGPSGLVD